MITFDLHSPEPPDVVLASLRERAGEWRESKIPRWMWNDGVSSIEANVRGATCTLTYLRRWREGMTAAVFADAVVVPEASGSVVHVTAGFRTLGPRALTAFGFVIVAAGVIFRSLIPLVFVVPVAINLLVIRELNRQVSRGDDWRASYLTTRIRAAVAAAGSSATDSSGGRQSA